MKKILTVLLSIALIACSKTSRQDVVPEYASTPTDVYVERLDTASVKVSWKDNSDSEVGFAVWVRNAEDASVRWKAGTVEKNVTSYVIDKGLQEGKSYFFGVQSLGLTEADNSRIIYRKFDLTRLPRVPSVKIEAVKSYPQCIGVRYRISENTDGSVVRHGLCWSNARVPELSDSCQYGPAPLADGSVFQVIPNTLLEYGRNYQVRAFVSVGSRTNYSSVAEGKIEDGIKPIQLDWKRITRFSLPSEVALYETTSPLNGKEFHAWYVEADLKSGNVQLRVNVPSSAATIDAQYAEAGGNCIALVNGGYFWNGNHTGVAVVDARVIGSIAKLRGSIKPDDPEYNSMYSVTRGLFGVDAEGKPAVRWVGGEEVGQVLYFDRPLPSVKGENKFIPVSTVNPCKPVNWNPTFALSAGPVLLKDGKCPFDFTLTDKGKDFYVTNYEMIPYDIFGPEVSPDRTAVGYTDEGRVILFVCDGRINSSKGATLLEEAAILKGIGCIGALNLDGGGSTGMVVSGNHLNDVSSNGGRAVVSTIGFYKRGK
ncbi:MAG: phosphodiester glycosidase family protein [Bacteroidales bacterium]|nr:phosphodiester glycosidase family protein [Bacteroidales bacterium]MDY6000993.1 phosphodiester glycosidase family protein [Candidatus Cryptobacteroides sp.]